MLKKFSDADETDYYADDDYPSETQTSEMSVGQMLSQNAEDDDYGYGEDYDEY